MAADARLFRVCVLGENIDPHRTGCYSLPRRKGYTESYNELTERRAVSHESSSLLSICEPSWDDDDRLFASQRTRGISHKSRSGGIGRRLGLKIPWAERPVPVRSRSPAPFFNGLR